MDWSTPERPKIDGTFCKPRKFLAWVATSAARGRMEVLFIEQKDCVNSSLKSSKKVKISRGLMKAWRISR